MHLPDLMCKHIYAIIVVAVKKISAWTNQDSSEEYSSTTPTI